MMFECWNFQIPRPIFGWMVHVYPYEDSLDKVFAMHHQMG